MLDVALNNGRLIDPAAGIDKTASIGFQNGRVKIISDLPLNGRQVFDVRGRIVCPGFIDVHGHIDGHRYGGQLEPVQGAGQGGLAQIELRQAQRQRDQEQGRWQREAQPGEHRARPAAALQANGKAHLAAGRAGQKLAQRHQLGIGRIRQPAAAFDEFGAEVTQVRDRPAE